MTSKISVERQFRFRCSCGETIVTGEKTVTCGACNHTLVIHRARRRRQRRRDSVSYYGDAIPVYRATHPGPEPSPPAAIQGNPAGRLRTIPVHRVEKHRENSKMEAVGAMLKSIFATCGEALKVRRVEEDAIPATHGTRVDGQAAGLDVPESDELPVTTTPRRTLLPGMHVKVGAFRPDGKPHPHGGKTGRIARFIDGHVQGQFQPTSAVVRLDPGILTQKFIWVSVECLEVLPEPRSSD